MNTYLVQLRGQVDVSDLNLLSPHQMTIIRMEPTCTIFSIHTDQAGLLGLIGHLHNLGLTLLSIHQADVRPLLENEHDS